jgi:hypothetical protein
MSLAWARRLKARHRPHTDGAIIPDGAPTRVPATPHADESSAMSSAAHSSARATPRVLSEEVTHGCRHRYAQGFGASHEMFTGRRQSQPRRDPPDLEDRLDGVCDHDAPDAGADEHQARHRRGHRHQDPLQARADRDRPRQQTNTQAWRRRWAAEAQIRLQVGGQRRHREPAGADTSAVRRTSRHPHAIHHEQRWSGRSTICPRTKLPFRNGGSGRCFAARNTPPLPPPKPKRNNRPPAPVLGSKRPSGATRPERCVSTRDRRVHVVGAPMHHDAAIGASPWFASGGKLSVPLCPKLRSRSPFDR